MATAPIEIIFPKDIRQILDRIPVKIGKGVFIGMKRALEIIRNKISSSILGGAKWNPRTSMSLNKKGILKADRGYSPVAYAMATVIAKGEGHNDFGRGITARISTGEFTKTGKAKTRKRKVGFQGAGWKRVLELVPRMATARPLRPQMVWIQTGQLRKSMRTKVIGSGKDIVGVIAFNRPYAKKVHEKYPYAVPVVKQAIADGTVADELTKGIIQYMLASKGKGRA